MKTLIRDRVLYFIIAVAVVAAALIIGLYDAEHGLNSDRQMQWIAAVIYTCFVFGFVIKMNLKLRRFRKFWALLLAFFLLHTFVVLSIVHVGLENSPGRVPLAMYMLVTVFEIGIFDYICAKLFKPKKTLGRASGHSHDE